MPHFTYLDECRIFKFPGILSLGVKMGYICVTI